MESLDQYSSYCGPCHGSGYPYYFQDHPASRGYWFEGPLLSQEGLLPTSGHGHTARFDGYSIVHAFPALHDWGRVLALEEWHSLYRVAYGWFGLCWVRRDSSQAFPHSEGMYSFLCFLPFLYSTQMWCSSHANLVASGPIDPPHLPWLVYAYSPNGFAWKCPLRRNKNVMGYPFPKVTQAISSISSLSCPSFSCISQYLF